MLNKLAKHLKNRTLIDAVARRIKRFMGFPTVNLNRFNISNKRDAILLLSNFAINHASKSGKKGVLIIGDDKDYTVKFIEKILKKGLYIETINLNNFLNNAVIDKVNDFGCIVAGVFDSKSLTAIGHKIIKDRVLNEIPFEYIVIPKDEYQYLDNMSYISPLLLSEIDFFDIYKNSLQKFVAKCEFRDFLDICQLLKEIINNHIEGDVAEFGSYKGHSGYLISQLLLKFGSEKQLFMFDMFEDFPVERIGVDHFWNKSHPVDFNEVQSKFKGVKNVTLVKGDFTATFKKMNIEKLSLVYIDCDSYRGTKVILEDIYENILAMNGVIILEDYGHGPLLGNRIAFHEFFDGRTDCFRFFSHFNGFQIVVKTKT
jgi:hypothetical protein